MSDSVSIPGLRSNENLNRLIDGMMEVERQPLLQLEEQRDRYTLEREAVSALLQEFNRLQESLNGLYGFQNPFQEFAAESSDSSLITATASRAAVAGSDRLVVKQLASAERLLSDSMDSDYRPAAGRYEFGVGDERFDFNFNGGKLSQLANAINSRGGDLITASVINDSADSRRLLLNGNAVGRENSITFAEDALTMALDIGLLRADGNGRQLVDLDAAGLTAIDLSGEEKELAVAEWQPLSGGSIDFSRQALAASADSQVIISFSLEKPQAADRSQLLSLPGAEIKFQDETVMPAASRLPENLLPPPENLELFTLNDAGRGLITMPPVENRAGQQQVSYRFDSAAGDLSGLMIAASANRLNIESIEIVADSRLESVYRPANPLAAAQDALVSFNGVDVFRADNSIDDLMPGVTLTLRRANPEKEVTVDVDSNRELIKDQLINFVGNYNRSLAAVNIMSNNNSQFIEEIEYYTDSERENAEKFLGVFNDDQAISSLSSSLRSMVMESYPNENAQSIELLSEIGISTNSGTLSGGSIDYSRLRGYLEIDEQALDTALSANLNGIKELFGHDSNGDLLVDSGVGPRINNFLKNYLRVNGTFSYRDRNLESRIRETHREIENYEQTLEEREAELRFQFAQSEAALSDLQNNSPNFDLLNSNSNR